MIPVLSREEMRAFDAHHIKAGVPSIVLMENAGRGAAEIIEQRIARAGDPVLVVCGTGNNGGDGWVVARRLHTRGFPVTVVQIGSDARITPDAKAQRSAYEAAGGKVRSSFGLDEVVASSAIVVDALFGTGLDRPLEDGALDAVRAMNRGKIVVALDIPSGLHANTGEVMGKEAVVAHHTITFAFEKCGHFGGAAIGRVGELHTVDIGVRSSFSLPTSGRTEARDVAQRIAPRAKDAHKYTNGHVAVVGGSAGKTGAAWLTAHAALRAGAGLVTVATLAEHATFAPEIMQHALRPETLADDLERFYLKKRVLVVGPGLGLDARARTVVEHVLDTFKGTVVLDADALSLVAEMGLGRLAGTRVILTPHGGELARLLKRTSEAIEADRFGAVRDAAEQSGATVVLKGPRTLVADTATLPGDGRFVWVNASGNPALGTAGSGDVLAGIVGAFAASAPSPVDAAVAGVWVHGRAAEVWAAAHGGADRGLLAHELAEVVPAVLAGLR
jgi:ADP-dependent NAD(P)H-hydrate dehydratase / NAD(P)H-hydrate epimerase